MPPEKKIEVLSSFQAKHPRIYTIIYQFLLLIITFYCAVAISRYGPEGGTYNPSSVVPEIDIPRPAPSDENSTTPHICKHGAREDLVDVGPLATIIPHLFLCPTTSVFLLSLITFSLSIYTLNALHSHTSDINLTPRAYAGLVGFTLFHIDWRNILLSLQIFMPIYIWGVTVIGVLLTLGLNWVMRMCFRGRFGGYKEANVEQNGGGEQGEDSAEIEKR